MPAQEGRGLELEAVSFMPLPGCSVRPFAGANCPHRTPLKSLFFDCGEYGSENQSGEDNGTFIWSGRFSLWCFVKEHGSYVIKLRLSNFFGFYTVNYLLAPY